jgi:hypothetical protein
MTHFVNRRIYEANAIASTDNANMDGLIQFAKNHPVIMKDIMEAYKRSPDFRFGDTLLIFCDGVKTGRIKLEPQYPEDMVEVVVEIKEAGKRTFLSYTTK